MGDLVRLDFNTVKQPEKNEESVSDLHLADKALSEDAYIKHLRQKRIEEKIYRKTYRRIRQDMKRSKNLKKKKLYDIIKRLFDLSVAGSAVAVLFPVFAGLALVIKLDDGGQPIFSQVRLGKNGKKIRIYKFRSMRMDSEDMKKLLSPKQLEQFFAEYKVDNDPRITRIGKFIRKTSIDELPQLFNILDGDMSLIGPRPIVKDETKYYKKKLRKLLSVKPGLTGYWQAYARSKATYRDGLRQCMELYYVDHACLGLDVKIFFKTIISVVKQEGAQ